MINPNLEPLGIFGMLLFSDRAIAINAISMVVERKDPAEESFYELRLLSGDHVILENDDAAEFEKQIKLIAQQLKFGAQMAGQIKRG